MLACKELKKVYQKTTAVDEISLYLEEGRIYALLGSNGSGKTTFMKMVAGLTKSDKGSILYKDTPIGLESKKEVAYMPTDSYFYPYMTLEDAGKFYEDFFDDFDRDEFESLMKELELNPKDKVEKMSTGMAARARLAVTMARKAKLFLLDEPFNGIDLVTRDKIMSIILKAAAEDTTIVISSHLVEELETMVDSVIFIKEGRNILVESADDIREVRGKSVADVYREMYA